MAVPQCGTRREELVNSCVGIHHPCRESPDRGRISVIGDEIHARDTTQSLSLLNERHQRGGDGRLGADVNDDGRCDQHGRFFDSGELLWEQNPRSACGGVFRQRARPPGREEMTVNGEPLHHDPCTPYCTMFEGAPQYSVHPLPSTDWIHLHEQMTPTSIS